MSESGNGETERQVIGKDVPSTLPDFIMQKVAEAAMPRGIGKTKAMMLQVAGAAVGNNYVLVVFQNGIQASEQAHKFATDHGGRVVRDNEVHFEGCRIMFATLQTEKDRSQGIKGPRFIDHYALERELLRLCVGVMD